MSESDCSNILSYDLCFIFLTMTVLLNLGMLRIIIIFVTPSGFNGVFTLPVRVGKYNTNVWYLILTIF